MDTFALGKRDGAIIGLTDWHAEQLLTWLCSAVEETAHSLAAPGDGLRNIFCGATCPVDGHRRAVEKPFLPVCL